MNWFKPTIKNSFINAASEWGFALPVLITSIRALKTRIRNITLAMGLGMLSLHGPTAIADPMNLDWFAVSGTTGTSIFREGNFSVDGVSFIGTSVGVEGSDFFQQYAVRVGGAGAAPSGPGGSGGSHSGGIATLSNGQPHCLGIASGSSSVCIADNSQGQHGFNTGAGFDPLGIITESMGGHIDVEDSGNGTNDPTTAVVRMILRDGEIYQEFLKGDLNYKHKITETLTTPDMAGTVSIDMRAIDFFTMNASAPFVNTLVFANPADNTHAGFNQATDAQNANVTAGQYVYLPQGGRVDASYRAGLYLFPDGGGFNMFDNDVYGFFFDPAQNVSNLGTNRMQPNACAAAGTCVLPGFAQD